MTSIADTTKQYLTIDELSVEIDRLISTIRRLVSRNKIAFRQPAGKGGRLLFPKDAIERSPENESYERTNKIQQTAKTLPGRKPRMGGSAS